MPVLSSAAVPDLGPLRILDARSGPDAKARFVAERLEGAQHLGLEEDLSLVPADAAHGGRHPFPPAASFCQKLGRAGVTPADSVLVLDDKDGSSAAARLYVMLRAIGHPRVFFLSGGLTAARRAGLPIAAGAPLQIEHRAYPVVDYALRRLSLAEVERAKDQPNVALLDARSAVRFRGETEPFDPPAGHVPGATSMPYEELFDAEGALLSKTALRERLTRAIAGRTEVIAQCGSGVTACVLLVAMEEAGLFRIGDANVSLWVGSYSEWSRNQKPIATGP